MKKNSLLFVTLFLLFSTPLFSNSFKVSYDPDYAPFSFSKDNKAYGLFIDIWKLWAQKNHHTLIFVKAKDWDDALSLAQTSKVDFFLGTEPYEEWMQASQTYYKTKTALFTRKILTQKDIKSIGIVGEDYKEELEEKFRDAKINSYSNYSELLNALVSKDIDAIYDDSIAISYFAIENKYTHIIKKTSFFSTASSVNAISAKKELVELFKKGFKKLNPSQLVELEKNWIYAKNERYFENEQDYKEIELHYAYDPDWRPFEYKDKMNKMHIGIIADILSLVSTKTGIRFIPVATDSWAESVDMAKHKQVEMLSAVPITSQRTKYLNFTKNSIYSYPAVLMSKKNSDLEMEEALAGKTIGIIKENSLGEWVKEQYPRVLFQEFTSVDNALDALEKGNIDFFAINGVTALYYINVLERDQFKIYSMMEYMFHLKIALRKDISKDILTLLDQGLSEITQKELSDIYHKWTSVKVKKELNFELLVYIFLFIIILISVFLLVNKKLKKIVQEKTNELQELNENLEEKVRERTQEIAKINKDIKANIEYASLIQNAILPLQRDINRFFQDAFVMWSPKDIVGGDIYFYKELSDDEIILIVLDCTGHGVSGAFVTMLTKAIEEQLLVEIQTKELTPSQMLVYFNKTFKNLLREESNSSVGFDAGIVYINKKRNLLKYAGAKIPLFYIDNGVVKQLKVDKHSVGYDHCRVDYQYKEESLVIKEGMKFYITSDGFLDQNGGEKGFPLGKRRFKEFIYKNQNHEFLKQKNLFLEQLKEYQGDEERNDDIVFIGFEI